MFNGITERNEELFLHDPDATLSSQKVDDSDIKLIQNAVLITGVTPPLYVIKKRVQISAKSDARH